MTIDLALFIVISIVTFTTALVIGYLSGWDDGAKRGFDIGWRESQILTLRELAKSRKDPT